MSIAKASPSDLIEVLYLLKIYIREMCSNGWLYWDIDNILVNKQIEDDIIFIYREEEVCTGLIMLKDCSVPDFPGEKKTLSIHSLIVHPCWRKQGIGRKLLQFAEQYAKEEGYESLNFFVVSENHYAVSLYEKLNYIPSMEVLSHYPEKPFINFQKQLAPI
jgi:ribosomal protein S18 acetylase RimI-like enzyme